MTGERADVVIVGGGIVGLATALALQDERLRVVVVEAEERLAAHQTGHNSGVIHSGLYYKPGSRKAQLTVAGREALYQLCREESVPHLERKFENGVLSLFGADRGRRLTGLFDDGRLAEMPVDTFVDLFTATQ